MEEEKKKEEALLLQSIAGQAGPGEASSVRRICNNSVSSSRPQAGSSVPGWSRKIIGY